jgi:hypothetical protein
MSQHKAPHREWAPALRHLGWNGDRVPRAGNLFDDYSGRGRAEREQDMTLEKTFTERDAKLTPPPYLNAEQLKVWNAYYEPRNEAFRQANPTGKDLVRWRYQRYMHDYLGTSRRWTKTWAAARLPRRRRPRRQHARRPLLRPGLLPRRARLVRQALDLRGIAHHAADRPLARRHQARQPCARRWSPSSIFPKPSSKPPACPCPPTCRAAACCRCCKGQTPADWRTSFYYHYYEFPGAHSVRKHYGVVTDRYKLFHFYEPEMNYWTLIDRETDPHEMKNVYAKDPA